MAEYENIFRRKELMEMFSSGEIKSLDDLYMIEDAALTVKELLEKSKFFKEYKKKKVQDINDAVVVLENKIKFFKEVIISTLKKNSQKSVKFPGSCAVSSRNQPSKWNINDEEEFVRVLQEAKKAGEKVDDALEVVTQYKVRAREASKLLDAWESSGKLEKFISAAKSGDEPVVYKEKSKLMVSLKFFDEEEEEDDSTEVSVPLKDGKTTDLSQFDAV